ncbi:MAG: hypothetical protein ACREFN_18005 [Acetobacteraceae bacterium]
MFRLTEHALLRLTERINALPLVPRDRSAIRLERDPLQARRQPIVAYAMAPPAVRRVVVTHRLR